MAVLVIIAALVSAATLLGACSSPDGGDGRPTIVATTTILGDLVREIVGDTARVETLMPPGADPHDYEPSAAQAAKMRRAALIVENGLGLEQRLQPAIDAAARDGVPVLVVGDHVDPVPLSDDPDVIDPHVWLDPERMSLAADVVEAEVLRVVGPDADASAIRANADRYRRAAVTADAEVRQLLASIPAPDRILITNHDALGYFARRYGLRVEDVVIPGGSSLAEPSAADIARLVATIRESGVRAIFSESTTSSRLPESIAREAGGNVRIVELNTDTLGRPGQSDSTYAGLLTELARRIADGLRSP